MTKKNISSDFLWNHLNQIRENKPLIHNITNQVVTQFSANALLALGASPLMAHSLQELEEIVAISRALVVNIGTLDKTQIESMKIAIAFANSRNIPIVVDPVGAGASQLRTSTSLELISLANNCIVKGNGGEILALAGNDSFSKGVDSLSPAEAALPSAQQLIRKYDLEVVIISGATDYVINSKALTKHSNGSSLMTKVTGMGCILSAVTAAFLAEGNDFFTSCQSAVSLIGLCGEFAGDDSKGPGSFKVHFLDQLHNITKENLTAHLRVASC